VWWLGIAGHGFPHSLCSVHKVRSVCPPCC
jgi:hypothetical protein